MKRLIAPNGLPIIGTLEFLTGRADVSDWTVNADGSLTPVYAGNGTEVFWNDQKTAWQTTEDGKTTLIVLDEDGTRHLSHECTLVDANDDPDD